MSGLAFNVEYATENAFGGRDFQQIKPFSVSLEFGAESLTDDGRAWLAAIWSEVARSEVIDSETGEVVGYLHTQTWKDAE